MPRLIDADALEARMYHDAFEVDSDMQRWDGGCWIRYKMFENAIKDVPTIEERKKGKWIDEHDMTCSVCGFECDDPYYLGDANYCPNCGARMER